MPKIKLLDEELITKIAAGEVVEGPASVVKELIENSIDAKATRIKIGLIEAGLTEIYVADNGIGMAAEDAELCILRHATSKISSEKDIFRITSLGFRGEALAAIASVSKMELVTKTASSETGIKLRIEAGKIIEKEQTTAKTGTRVIVKSLFYNVPARKKHLKSLKTELKKAIEAVTAYALSYPEIFFELEHNKKKLIVAPVTGLKNRIAYLFGPKTAKSLIRLDNTLKFWFGELKIKGYISGTTNGRKDKSMIFCFVNRRYVKNRLLKDALCYAYETFINRSEYPIAIISITISPDKVDVNVHPQKKVLRLEHESAIYEGIFESVRKALIESSGPRDFGYLRQNKYLQKPYSKGNTEQKALEEAGLEKNSRILPGDKRPTGTEDSAGKIEESYRREKSHKLEGGKYEHDSEEPKANSSAFLVKDSKGSWLKKDSFFVSAERQTELLASGSALSDSTLARNKMLGIAEFSENNAHGENRSQKQTASLRAGSLRAIIGSSKLSYIGQAFKCYLIFEAEKELVIVDQHAAEERINYELFFRQMKKSRLKKQDLLEPVVIEASQQEIVAMEDKLGIMEELGFELEVFSRNSFILRSVPAFFEKGLDYKAILKEIISELSSESPKLEKELKEKEALAIKLRELIMIKACRASVKANKVLYAEQAKKILASLVKCENSLSCPHGRPTFIKLTKAQIEKMFKRP